MPKILEVDEQLGYLKSLADSGDFPDRHLADRLLSEKKFPEVYATDDVDLDDLCEKSEKMRDRMIKGEI